jgi:hypothetical protein
MTVTLTVKTKTGTDDLHAPIYEETSVAVDNVLIGEPSTEEIVNEYNLSGKRIAYVLAIPKGDAHDWTDTTVSFWGMKFRTIGIPTQGIEHLIPLQWNKKVKVERYEQADQT